MSKAIPINNIQNCIFTIRGMQVMLDSDLAEMYQVSTGRLNEQVKRNIERFPEDFMFQLTEGEWNNLKSQIAISSWAVAENSPTFLQSKVSPLCREFLKAILRYKLILQLCEHLWK